MARRRMEPDEARELLDRCDWVAGRLLGLRREWHAAGGSGALDEVPQSLFERFWSAYDLALSGLVAARRRRRTLDRIEAGLRRLEAGRPFDPEPDPAKQLDLFDIVNEG